MLKTDRADAFPKTPRSWICTQLGLGAEGLAAANRHIMHGYAEPLKVYFRGSSFRNMADADEVVNAFFADRLGRMDFLVRWEESERPMRYWLLVAFRYFLMEQRARRVPTPHPPDPDAVDHSADPATEFHSEVARTIVRQAAERAESECRDAGLAEHWEVWIRHHIEGRSLAELASQRGERIVRMKVMARTAGNRFRRTLRELVAWPGASRERVDQEIQELISTLSKDSP